MRWMILAAALSMAVSTTSQAAPIYKWVDAQGVTHFDAQPPAGQQVEEINVQKPPPAPAASTASEPDPQQQEIDAKVRKQVRAQEAKMADNCEVLRTNLAQLQNNPRVREQTEGGTKRLTDDERKARVAETQRTIDEYCR
ncbi:DUF4124 domain-containing protein [Pseudomonas cichorii]|uniref:DUF4124 domain-containing protein n=1 Tax=Pseudomonas lijiangensis TaxID=2995658 RepID=A0ABX8HUD9_9PSED|nr:MULTISPECIES: DUF4124 domain-containing protein [Pseudomonas syringae group]MBX8492485.1 DUF4124 domain-containing protein [Pseudomonas cichorii]MBX8502193.1 DUF4124 domain-containing protein [Pseudomonas lijiangensis]MBX8506936.1 DUF4124 domain-containing protein [Pseudomonas lijiangensis]MBX8512119.1 DUF4124 domain-containing protein [Pseudomonas cichorii]MBX8522852.1 DUF4124 domain-containing protein [Pseudomonas cichorii]